MNKLEHSIKSGGPTISSEVEALRAVLIDIEVLSETLISEILHGSMDTISATEVTSVEGHSLDSLFDQINFMNRVAFRVKDILQNISTGLGSFSKGGQ